MRKASIILLLAALAAGLLLVGAAWASTSAAAVDWYVLSGGGVIETGSGALSLSGTVGQAVAGWAGEDLCAGFWCGADLPPRHTAYLPVVVRNQ